MFIEGSHASHGFWLKCPYTVDKYAEFLLFYSKFSDMYNVKDKET